MKPGSKPKPTALKELEGNPGHRKLPENELKPQIKILRCPHYIKKDRYAKQEWDRIVPELYNSNLLTSLDLVPIEIMCTQYSLYRAAIEDIRVNGLTSSNARHGTKPNPSIAIAREAAKIYKSFAVEFGLTPSSRVRISVPDQFDDEEEWQKMLNEGK